MRRRVVLSAAGFALAGVLFAGPVRADLDATLPAKASAQITTDLAHADLNAIAADAAKYMGPDAAP